MSFLERFKDRLTLLGKNGSAGFTLSRPVLKETMKSAGSLKLARSKMEMLPPETKKINRVQTLQLLSTQSILRTHQRVPTRWTEEDPSETYKKVHFDLSPNLKGIIRQKDAKHKSARTRLTDRQWRSGVRLSAIYQR